MRGVGRLIAENTDLVEREAWRMYRMLRLVEHEDLVGNGNVALVQAARRYQSERGVPFRAFATRRIRGSMLDVIREAIRRRHVDGELVQVASLDDDGFHAEPVGHPDVALVAEQRETIALLGELPERERAVIVRTRIEGDSPQQLADELGTSTSGVARVTRRAEARLRLLRRRQST